MLTVFDQIEKDQEISAVVLTSNDRKNWSLGIDVQWMAQVMAGGERQFVDIVF